MNRRKLLKAAGQLRPFSTDILDASYKATTELFTEVSAKFRNEQYQWHQVCESTYDNYMIRRTRS